MQMNESAPLLSIENLVTGFPKRDGRFDAAVDGVSLAIPRGRTVALVGESGCGKSMTAMSVMGLVPASGRVASGHIYFEGRDLLALNRRALRELTGDRLAMIFQEPMTSLNPVQTVGKQVCEGLLRHRAVSRREAKARAIEVFERVGIPEPASRFYAYPHQLSGGLRQRVMIGMAMICEPALLIADEPTTALDVTIEAQILRLMKQLQIEHGTSILMITHNLGVVAEICDSVYVMYAGQVVEVADVFELFRAPAHPYTRGLMRALPRLTGNQDRLYNIRGTVCAPGSIVMGCRFAPRCDGACDRCRAETPALREIAPGHFARCHFAKEGAV